MDPYNNPYLSYGTSFMHFSYFFTYNVNYNNTVTGKVIFNLLDKKAINFRSHIIYTFIDLLRLSYRSQYIEREKYYSATGRNSLCRSNRIAVIVRRFIVTRRLPQEQNYALPRFVMFLRYQAMRFVARYFVAIAESRRKKKKYPRSFSVAQ